jgi:hypothetical protein
MKQTVAPSPMKQASVSSTDHGGGKRRDSSGMSYIYTNKQCITTTPAKSECDRFLIGKEVGVTDAPV